MKSLPLFLMIAFIFGCKKSDNIELPKFTDDSEIEQVVNFRVWVTKPSPYDIEHHSTIDSLIIKHIRKAGFPDALQNLNTSLNLGPSFGFTLDTTNFQSTGHSAFILSLPNGNMDTQKLNTPYENTYRGDYYTAPFFLSMHNENGITVGHYFGSSQPGPEDANETPQVVVYCKVTITKKYQVDVSGNTHFIVVDGKFSGYYEASWGKFDLNNYVNRFDFSCDFAGVRLRS